MALISRLFSTALACTLSVLSSSPAEEFRWSPDDDTLSTWVGEVGLESQGIEGDALNLRITDPNPYTKTRALGFEAAQFPFLFVKLSADRMVSGEVGIYFGTEAEPTLNDAASIFVPATLGADMQTVAIDLTKCPKWRDVITSMRLDLYFEVGVTLRIAEIYFGSAPSVESQGDWHSQIESGLAKFGADSSEGTMSISFVEGQSGRAAWTTTETSLLPLSAHEVSAEFRNDAPFDPQGENALRIRFFDDEGSEISAGAQRVVSEKSGEWKKLGTAFRVPENATDARIELEAAGSSGTAWWRGFQLNAAGTDASTPQEASWRGAWIRHPSGPVDNRSTFFRKEFDLPGKPLEARVQVSADDGFSLFVNGREVHTHNIPDGWMSIQIVDITPFLKTGRNVIGLRNFNLFGHDGVILDGKIHLDSGATQDLFTDGTWMATESESPHWASDRSDGSAWVAAQVIGLPPTPPWGRIPYDPLIARSTIEARLAAPVATKVAQGDSLQLPLALSVQRYTAKPGRASLQLFKQELCAAEIPLHLPDELGEHKQIRLLAEIPTVGLSPGKYEARLVIEGAVMSPGEGRLGTIEITGNTRDAHPLTAVVQPWQGTPTLHVNGKPVFTNLYYSAYNSDRLFKFFVRDFTEVGYDYFILTITTPLGRGVASSWWTGPGQYDFSVIDGPVKKFLAANPRAKILLSLGVDAPAWWAAKHPEELVRYEGESPSYISSPASALWRKESGESFRAALRHVESSDYAGSIIGYRATGHADGGEWQYMGGWEDKIADFSAAMTTHFRNWLKEKYRSQAAALQAAWNNRSVTFETAEVPTQKQREEAGLLLFRDPASSQQVMDYLRCHNETIATAILSFAAISKEAAPRKISMVYGGYSMAYEGTELVNNGQLGYDQVFKSDLVDMVCGPNEYRFRDPGQPSGFFAPVDSLRLHGKLWVAESDLRTFLSGNDSFNKVRDLRQAIGSLKRDFALSLTTRTGVYWFDMVGGWYANKGMVTSLGKMREVGEKACNTRPPSNPKSPSLWISTRTTTCGAIQGFSCRPSTGICATPSATSAHHSACIRRRTSSTPTSPSISSASSSMPSVRNRRCAKPSRRGSSPTTAPCSGSMLRASSTEQPTRPKI